MANPIGWCDVTRNPGVGCAKCSPGCRRCYALPMAVRLAHNPTLPPEVRAAYRAAITRDERPSLLGEKPAWRWSGRFVPIPGALERFADDLGRWRKPRVIFVESMGDLFHPTRPPKLLDQLLCLINFYPRHAFVFLTKRVREMADSLMQHDMMGWSDRIDEAAYEMWGGTPDFWTFEWPLPNLWLMATVEDQERAEERIPTLLEIPAALHGVSVEPMLGAVDQTRIQYGVHDTFKDCGGCPDPYYPTDTVGVGYTDVLRGEYWSGMRTPDGKDDVDSWQLGMVDEYRLGWVIAGGETGPGARAMQEEWALSLRDQCAGAGVPFWFKGWGDLTPPSMPAESSDSGLIGFPYSRLFCTLQG